MISMFLGLFWGCFLGNLFFNLSTDERGDLNLKSVRTWGYFLLGIGLSIAGAGVINSVCRSLGLP